MKLSIIIPVYNVEKYLESCILSVLKQSEINDTEIILVDDCGKDDSINIAKRIVKEYSVNYNIKIVFHTHNQGLSAARNTGVKNATGDYVFFLDSDDELPENTIVTFKEYLSQYGNNVDFFVGNYIVEGPFKGSILGLVEPVLATIVSAAVLKQAFSFCDILGITMILAGVTILSVYQSKN